MCTRVQCVQHAVCVCVCVCVSVCLCLCLYVCLCAFACQFLSLVCGVIIHLKYTRIHTRYADIITDVDDSQGDGWYEGTLNGKRGVFPGELMHIGH